MNKIRKILAILICAVCMFAAACSDNTVETDKTLPNSKLTAHWSYYSVTRSGTTFYRNDLGEDEDESKLPRFNTEDGKIFDFAFTANTSFTGEIIENGNSTYTMIIDNNTSKLDANIKGNTLTITLPSGDNVVFVETEPEAEK